MKNNTLYTDIGLSMLLIILTTLFYNPFQALWMPTKLMTMILLCFILTFVLFSVFMWKEKSHDEREEVHRSIAGRASFFVGSTLLVVAIILQSLAHALDPWLLYILIGMIVTKLIVRVYAEHTR